MINSLSVHIFAALFGAAFADNFNFFDRELVVVGKFFTGNNFSHGENNDVLFAENIHNLRVTVGLKKMYTCK